MTQADRLHDELEATLLRLAMLLPDDQTVWDDNELVRLAVERLWIYAGTTAEAYRVTAELDRGDQPWSSCTSSATSSPTGHQDRPTRLGFGTSPHVIFRV